MFDVHAYLRHEFRRYFPDARKIDVHVQDEAYDVAVHLKVCGILRLHMDVGSDDELFRFTADSGATYTIPFSEQM